MDGYEAIKMVLSRIQCLDPDNASKIMGYLLTQDQPEEEMIRLACGPETHLLSFINKAKACLGLLPTNSSMSRITPDPTRPEPLLQCSPRVIIPTNNGFHVNNLSSPSSPWSGSSFSDHWRSPRPPSSLSYAAVLNGTIGNVSSSVSKSSLSLPFYGNSTNSCDLGNDEFNNLHAKEQFAFMDESLWKNVDFMDPLVSPGARSDSDVPQYGNNSSIWVDSSNSDGGNQQQHFHRRSVSVSDTFLGGAGCDDMGGGGNVWRPCMYFARGFCKNGNSCKFLHNGFADLADGLGAMVGSPCKVDGVAELLRLKAIQHQRLITASQLSRSHPLSYNKYLFSNSHRPAAATLMLGDEFHRFSSCQAERNAFGAMGLGANANSGSRQIYLTFPADSTFKEEDVSNYFSTFGPIQDVRIPYQQKRMFGFVTFAFPDTVKLILAKGNPHFVCDSRVLVKPYKEKGKVPDRKQHQPHMVPCHLSGLLSPSELDSREPFDHQFGGRILNNTHEKMMLRRKLEEHSELQEAIEQQCKRLMNLPMMDINYHHPSHQCQPNLSAGIPISRISLTQIQAPVGHNDPFQIVPDEDFPQENKARDGHTSSSSVIGQKMAQELNESCDDNFIDREKPEKSDVHERC